MRYNPVPHFGQRPFIAFRPFFIVTCVPSFISRFALHFTQYASIRPPLVTRTPAWSFSTTSRVL